MDFQGPYCRYRGIKFNPMSSDPPFFPTWAKHDRPRNSSIHRTSKENKTDNKESVLLFILIGRGK